MSFRCCNNDGLILKPFKPATAIDEQIYATAFLNNNEFGDIWSTYTSYATDIGVLTFGIVLAFDLKSEFYVTQNNCGFQTNVIKNLLKLNFKYF